MSFLRFVLVPVSLGLMLGSCSSSSGSTSSTDSVTTYTGSGFTISIPTTWTPVDPKTLPTLANGKIALALSSPEITSGFANNMSILSDTLSDTTTSMQYSIVNYTLSTGKYLELTKLAEKKISFADKDTANLYAFEARYNDQTPKEKFLQTAKVCGQKAYLLTIGVGIGTSSTTRYEDLLTSFACTDSGSTVTTK